MLLLIARLCTLYRYHISILAENKLIVNFQKFTISHLFMEIFPRNPAYAKDCYLTPQHLNGAI